MEIHVVVECQLASEVYGQVPEEAAFFSLLISRLVFSALDGRRERHSALQQGQIFGQNEKCLIMLC